VEAYEFYLRGRKRFQEWTRQSIGLAREMFQRATELDPHFAGAWAGLATAHVHLFGYSDPHLEKAREASRHALALDPQLPSPHLPAGQVCSMERRYAEAATAFERAIELDSTFFDTYYYYARACFKNGDFEKAVRLAEKAEAVRPEDYNSPYLVALALTKLDRLEEARRAEERARERLTRHLDLNPDDARACVLLAGVLAKFGETERARPLVARAMSLASDDDATLYNAGCVLATLGEDEQALDALEKAIGAGLAGGGDWVSHDPDWERLRDNPRFKALVARLVRSR